MENWSEASSIQPIVSKMLTNSIQKDRISHAYLFQGQKGTGKRDVSLLFCKSIFCKSKSGVDPCNQCKDCNRINTGNHPDVHWIEPEGASIKTEQIELLQKEFSYTGLESNRKIYVVSHADKMTTNASNRLLKFLEEPSRQTTAMLLTENTQSILPTIRSRCQIMALTPLKADNLQQKLVEEGISTSHARIASTLTNNYVVAKGLCEDEWFANARKLVVQLVEVLPSKSGEALLFISNQWMPHFKDREQLQMGLDLLLLWYKDLIYKYIEREESIVFIDELDRLEQSMMVWSRQFTTDILGFVLEAKRKLEQNVHPVLVMEQLTLHIQR
ncbi:DNA polymerase III subunit delta' (plasmid) [Radiobacillus kanasensis]|uniref:DNA polymerase III subunit delta' n=1 Tax=Radiobacillus kanasensis TaxID=2844358 RepID=UPI001E600351|nr:DNA polymerase III subunit delta' [Radiobacillus kanasensis]UFU01503.1 DNA polymerase III subunit delta' [Radiobacillus kanasensis]